MCVIFYAGKLDATLTRKHSFVTQAWWMLHWLANHHFLRGPGGCYIDLQTIICYACMVDATLTGKQSFVTRAWLMLHWLANNQLSRRPGGCYIDLQTLICHAGLADATLTCRGARIDFRNILLLCVTYRKLTPCFARLRIP